MIVLPIRSMGRFVGTSKFGKKRKIFGHYSMRRRVVVVVAVAVVDADTTLVVTMVLKILKLILFYLQGR